MAHPGRWARFALYALALIAGAYVAAQVGHVVRLLVISSILAYLLEPAARSLESHGLSRAYATGLIFLCLAGAATVFFVVLVPVLIDQLVAAREGVDAETASAAVAKMEQWLERISLRLGLGDVELVESVRGWVLEHRGTWLSYLPGAVALLSDLVIIPFIMFFLLKDGPAMIKRLISWVPNRYFEFALNVLHKSSVQAGNYLRGQAVAAANVAILSGIALAAIGVDFYIIIAVIAGLANMIPYVGPWAGAALAIATSVLTTGSFDDVAWITASFILIQLIDNTLVQPLVVSRRVQMHPLSVLLAVIVGGQLFGFWGLLLAVPAYAAARVVVSETLINLRRFRLLH